MLDAHQLPHDDDILVDCAKGKFWSKLNITNSFFQTLVHPDDVPLMAVTTPFRLYEWVVMPMGLKNALPIHQQWMTTALHDYISQFCHVYIDDMVIWSDNLVKHQRHVDIIMEAIQQAQLYLNEMLLLPN